ncbi:exosome complex component Rrp43p [[Candida] jaroonii]|uniref:Exosome complex component Rrp43p n=1 Tax=[Candida] jaroonii TaxID=467808 RepID=A0ACA9Y1F4_9ASCO|nr:exosome complex component Rrp43p [[Candida] jaroonii]
MDSISFPPEVLERIIPDLSLERHIKSGIRPNYRNFQEFRNIEILKVISNEKLTTLYIKNGITLIIATISYTINEIMNYTPNQFTSVYPSLSVSRGRTISGAPTDEEMNLCQNLYETLLANKFLPLDSLVFKPKLKVDDEFIDIDETDFSSNLHQFNLSINFKVLGRSGPLFDILYYSLIECLKNFKLPEIYMEDSIELRNQIFVNPVLTPVKLNIQNNPISSNFGIYKLNDENFILCDLENESEESNIITKSSIISDGENLLNFNFINGNLLDITKDDLIQMIKLSETRSKKLSTQ